MAKHTRKMKMKKTPKYFSSEPEKRSIRLSSEKSEMSKHFSNEKPETSKHSSKKPEKTSNVPGKKSLDSDSVLDYFNLCTQFETHIKEYRNSWKFTLEENLVFYKINTTDQPKIIASIKIDKNLKVYVFLEYGEVKQKDLTNLLNERVVLEYWVQLKNLLQHFGTENIYNHINVKRILQHALKCLQKCTDNKSILKDNTTLRAKLQFIFSQVYALTDNKYTEDIISLAYSIYLKSSACYTYLQSIDSITLPKEDDLVKYVQ